jgi:acyl dehydratase
MTAERMRWYADALETCTYDSELPIVAELNIHTDDDIARATGLPARVADGMVSTNWVSTLLADLAGDGYLAHGSLFTRYVKPIFVDERIEVVIRVLERTLESDDQERIHVEVACNKEDGQVATGGRASFLVPRGYRAN